MAINSDACAFEVAVDAELTKTKTAIDIAIKERDQ